MRNHGMLAAVCVLVLLRMSPILAREKPAIWVYTDLSDTRDLRAGFHPQNDPDDHCSLAALLLEANRFQIRGIVFSSTYRPGLKDATQCVEATFLAAYQHDLPLLNKKLGGYQETLPFHRSSIAGAPAPVKFNPVRNYADLGILETVKALIEVE